MSDSSLPPRFMLFSPLKRSILSSRGFPFSARIVKLENVDLTGLVFDLNGRSPRLSQESFVPTFFLRFYAFTD